MVFPFRLEVEFDLKDTKEISTASITVGLSKVVSAAGGNIDVDRSALPKKRIKGGNMETCIDLYPGDDEIWKQEYPVSPDWRECGSL